MAGLDASTVAPETGRVGLGVRYALVVMLITASDAFAQTTALLITFLGVGLVANVLIVYIIAQVLAERRQNREYREFREGGD